MSGSLQNLLLLTSPFGDDTLPVQPSTLHATGLNAVEQLSTPFAIGLDVISTQRGLSPDALLNQSMTVTVRRKDGVDRYFNGIVRHIHRIGSEQRDRWQYHVEIVPRLWFLSQTIDCRIFQHKTPVEILRQIYSEHGVSAVDFRISGSQTQREYVTQFNEDDLTFCHRLMQESGLFYFFEHTKSDHKLIVTDSNQTFRKMARPEHRVIWLGDNVDIFDQWSSGSGLSPGQINVRDYDPERPSTPVMGEQSGRNAGPGGGQRKHNIWPAMTCTNVTAKDRARFHSEAAESHAALHHGHGYDPNLCPGFRFDLASDPVSGASGVDYAVFEVRHSARDESWVGGGGPSHYDCHFSCFEQKLPWREPLTIRRPTMPGIFSGIVIGEGGEEIHADRLGRIKVRPLFDHREETVASMAIWARVMSPWSGDSFGWQHLPRVGTEVGLSFMSGDCDNPVVVGCFYHEQSPPVFAIPTEQTKQGFRSRSTHGGSASTFNELSFDDRHGQEMLYVRAQKDMGSDILRDQSLTIGRDQTDTVKRHRNTTINNNETLTSLEGNITVTADKGDLSMSADAGIVTINAAKNLVLRCGGSTITMTPGEISINAPHVKINCTG